MEKESGVSGPLGPALFLSSLAREASESQDSPGVGPVPSPAGTRMPWTLLSVLPPSH